MSTTLYTARNELKTHLNAYAPLAAVPVYLERQGADIDADVEATLDGKGLAIIILSSAAAVADQISQGGAVLQVMVPVCILENPKANAADAGLKLPSEDAVELVMTALLGQPAGDGVITLSQEVFARGGDESGLIEHYVGFIVPLVVRGV